MKLFINGIKYNIQIISKTMSLIWKASSKMTIVIFLLTLLSGLSIPLNMIIWRNLLNSITEVSINGDFSSIIIWLILNWGIWVFSNILHKFNDYYKTMQSDYINLYITELVLNKINELELINFDDAKTYDKVNKINNEALSKSLSIMDNIVLILQSIINLIGVFSILLSYNVFVAFLILVVFIPVLMLDIRISNKLHNLYNKRIEKLRLVFNLKSLMIKYENIKELKIFQNGQHIISIISDIYKNYIGEDKKIKKKNLLIQSAGSSLEYLSKFIFSLQIIISGIQKKLPIGDILMYVDSVNILLQSMENIILSSSRMYTNNLFIQTLFEFLDSNDDLSKNGSIMTLENFKKMIFNHVYFKYPNSNTYILEDINLEIEANKSYLIVGLNGAGKTTLIKLLCNLYSPTKGKISVDGNCVSDYDKNSYRKNFAVVFQDFIRYPLDVETNIKFGQYENKNDNLKMQEAAENSGALDFIKDLPDSYKTLLQNEWSAGIELSTGQWQKLAIARALFSDAPIIIMDEPTASLDAIAENDLYMKIKETIMNKTCIMISHRYTTAKIVDQIIVINNRKIVESGTFDDLMNKNGMFKKLFSMQANKYNYEDNSNDRKFNSKMEDAKY